LQKVKIFWGKVAFHEKSSFLGEKSGIFAMMLAIKFFLSRRNEYSNKPMFLIESMQKSRA